MEGNVPAEALDGWWNGLRLVSPPGIRNRLRPHIQENHRREVAEPPPIRRPQQTRINDSPSSSLFSGELSFICQQNAYMFTPLVYHSFSCTETHLASSRINSWSREDVEMFAGYAITISSSLNCILCHFSSTFSAVIAIYEPLFFHE